MGPAAQRSDETVYQDNDGPVPDAETLGRLIAPSSPRHRSVQQLHALLTACRPGDPAEKKAQALADVAKWLQGGRGVVTPIDAAPGDSPQAPRLPLFIPPLPPSPPLAPPAA